MVLLKQEFHSFYLMQFVFCFKSAYKLIASKLNKIENIPFEILLVVTYIMGCTSSNFLETSLHLEGITQPL
jgi:hypothetical protein